MIDQKVKSVIRDVPDFPKEGIVFKDITPIFQDASLVEEIVKEIVRQWDGVKLDAVAGVESRGFLLGPMIAKELNVPFIPIRKKGKLPYTTIEESYDLEYGSATIEMHIDAVKEGQNVLVHDDLLATGGTAKATGKLIEKVGGEVAGFSFMINLSFLNGESILKESGTDVKSLINY